MTNKVKRDGAEMVFREDILRVCVDYPLKLTPLFQKRQAHERFANHVSILLGIIVVLFTLALGFGSLACFGVGVSITLAIFFLWAYGDRRSPQKAHILLETVCGIAWKRVSHGYWLCVEDRAFEVDPYVLDVFTESYLYTIVYTQGTQTLVAAKLEHELNDLLPRSPQPIALLEAAIPYTTNDLHTNQRGSWSTTQIQRLQSRVLLHLTYKQDLHELQVEVVQGRLRKHISDGLQIMIGEMTFSVSSTALDAFVEMDEYRVYYAPHSKTILSVERLNYDE